MDRLTATRVFVEVVERGSQTAAADALEMSRAMVSRYLGELETWVGARLLHRTTRKLSLTGAGEQLLGQCREMLAMADAMQSVSRTDEAAPRGTLRIACSQSLAQAWLVHALDDFTRLYPQVSVDLLVGSQAVNLVEARIDLAPAHHQSARPQPDRPPAGGVPFGGVRNTRVPGQAWHAAAARGAGPTQLPELCLFWPQHLGVQPCW